jgi:hypothetical protein
METTPSIVFPPKIAKHSVLNNWGNLYSLVKNHGKLYNTIQESGVRNNFRRQ